MKNQQIEFDVFPKYKQSDYAYLSEIKDGGHPEEKVVNVVFSHQSVIIILICAVMSLVASFTLGVEKGKLIAKNTAVSQTAQAAASASAGTAADMPDKTAGDLAGAEGLKAAENKTSPQQKVQGQAVLEIQKQEAPVKQNTEPKNGYTIQVASVKTNESAESLSAILMKRGFMAFIRPSGKYLIVMAGDFAQKQQAQAKLKELKKTFTDCFVRKI